MTRKQIIVTAAAFLWLVHIGVLAALGTGGHGPMLSDLIQLALGGLLIYAIVDAGRRADGIAISFWRLAAAAYALLLVAQGLSVFNDIFKTTTVAWTTNLLFCFWFAPLAMAMFLDPDKESGKIETLAALDFVQGVLVCVAAYVYFFYLPKAENPGELAHEVWAPYFVGYSFVAGSFLLRAMVTSSRDVRVLFGRMGIFLTISGCADAFYHYGPIKNTDPGSWFDLIWSALLLIPLGIVVTWKQFESPEVSLDAPRSEKPLYTEMFYLFYPLLVLIMSFGIARTRIGLAAVFVLLTFICASARLLVTQHRLVKTQDALRREASRDGLTSLWNRKAILSILERELLRAERDEEPVGLIMIDVDHFKAVNDSRGHAAGDAILRIIATGIAAVVRPYDSVGRYGGEEFLIVAPACGPTETWELAERVRSHVAGCNIMTGGSAIHVSLSLGIATGKKAVEIEKLLHAADAAMYQAKHAGRNRVEPSLGRAASASQGTSTLNRDFWI
ncbi:MAG TPA: GGDEF domain-containing protein [Candidatus Sulfotelmatobacter sp.]|nr:GGDEF domain-containing protein [Candidatus Sulfotelmatobacter sp.]